MDATVRAWLLAQLGTTTNTDDLGARYLRLGSAKAVAAEVLAERRAQLLADPLRMTVDGVVTMDNSNNLTGIERQIEALADLTAPDEQGPADDLPELTAAPLRPARRRA
jgi:hypothetical protein